ncbi:MAG TPA: hypothetical protein PLF81_05995 [Candidatus Anammoximicrobium sp.]|nr:hypothetical protein [Candidatus Anammoximicrobium sp.]
MYSSCLGVPLAIAASGELAFNAAAGPDGGGAFLCWISRWVMVIGNWIVVERS